MSMLADSAAACAETRPKMSDPLARHRLDALHLRRQTTGQRRRAMATLPAREYRTTLDNWILVARANNCHCSRCSMMMTMMYPRRPSMDPTRRRKPRWRRAVGTSKIKIRKGNYSKISVVGHPPITSSFNFSFLRGGGKETKRNVT